MSSKSIALFQAHLAAQGRAPKAPINIMGTTPRSARVARAKKSQAPISGKVNVQTTEKASS